MALVKDTYKVKCKVKAESEKAILIFYDNLDGDNDSSWIPLSQVEEINRSMVETEKYPDTVVMQKWLAKKRNIV